MPTNPPPINVGKITQSILLIRGEKVIIDSDLADIYGVTTKAHNQAVRRNSDRFPPDFAFRLTKQEKEEVVTICDHLENLKYSRVNPHAFTEHGAIMAASVLNSPKAIEVSVFVVRAFVQLRESIQGNKDLAAKLAELERKLSSHDRQIWVVIEAIRQLMAPEPPPDDKRIGFLKS
ncbi:MAG: ORF6N domain-containing protein [Acidobacteriota bacterium]|nr:MAG: ORF6N domain-containing protein [Acidobacteriota bacterium]